MHGGTQQKPLIWQSGTRPGARPMLLGRFRGQAGAPRMLNIAFRLQRFQLGGKKGGVRAAAAEQKKPLV